MKTELDISEGNRTNGFIGIDCVDVKNGSVSFEILDRPYGSKAKELISFEVSPGGISFEFRDNQGEKEYYELSALSFADLLCTEGCVLADRDAADRVK